jgi:hypothetical protein
MGKSRTLANTVSNGGPLADGAIGVAEVDGLQATLDAKLNASAAANYATLAGAQTLTNKTITEMVSVISTNTTAVPSTVYVLTASLTLTLPAAPAVGSWVRISNMSNTLTAVVARNGSNIMSLAENMTIDRLSVGITMMYADATRGWVIQ